MSTTTLPLCITCHDGEHLEGGCEMCGREGTRPPDAFEVQARALARQNPSVDFNSTQAIQAVAIGLRETWRMARESRDAEVLALMEKADNFERSTLAGWRRAIEAEEKLATTLDDLMAANRRIEEFQAQNALLEQTIQNGAEMIRAAHARADAAEADAARYRYLKDHCTSHYAMTWEQPAEWSIGWEFQQRTPDEAIGSFDYLIDRDITEHRRREAEIEAEENDGLEECGNHSATDPVKTAPGASTLPDDDLARTVGI